MSTKQKALDSIIKIANKSNLSIQDIDEAFIKDKAIKDTIPPKSGSIMTHVFGYLGGIFILAGIGVYIAMFWESMNSPSRVVITLGSGFFIYLMAVSCHIQEKFKRAATPLFIVSALLQPTGIFVMLREYSTGGDERHGVLFMASIMLIQQLFTFIRTKRLLLALTSLFFGCIALGTSLDIMGFYNSGYILSLGFSIYILALIAHFKDFPKFATVPFFLLAGYFQATGIFEILRSSLLGIDDRYVLLLTVIAMLTQQILTLIALQRTIVAFISIAFGCTLFITIFDLLNLEPEYISLIIGFSLMCIAYALNKTTHKFLTPIWHFIGAISFLTGAFTILEESPIEILFLGVACGMLFISTYAKSRVLLIVSTLSILSYIGYFTKEHFVNSIGWPIALIFMGFTLIGMSALAFRLNRKYIQENEE